MPTGRPAHPYPPQTIDPRAAIARIKWLYLLTYMGYGCTSIYRNLYFRRVGLDNSQVGLLIAVQPLVMLIAGPLWSLLADRLHLRSRLLSLVLALSIVPALATPLCTQFWPLMAWNLLYAVMQAPIQPLMDSSAVLALGANRHQYSAIRAYGSLGYAPLVYLTGALSERIDLRWSFVGFAFFTFIAMLVSLKVRSDESALQSNVLTGLSAVGKDHAWQQMMVAVFISSILQAIAFSYSGLYLDTLHASESLIGLSGALGSISQTLLMFTLLPWLVRHWGGERLLVFSFVMFALRLAVWALVPNPVAVTLSEALLGLTTGAALAGSVDFAARKAPPGLAATAQSLMSCLVNGLGRTTGSAVAGELYDTLGPQPLFGGFAALAGVSAMIFAWVWRQILGDREQQA